ncbi:anti-sigma factor domain-containing protein [Kitasatospora sp. NPDC051853]|uniref:anti-sigma factor n=1 Tax=Kitasatospora sp. NPDC051853 TaxID=3364058 RepID=UPI0037BC26BF
MTSAPELHTLSGAYAAHALAEPEREAFERHLTDCHACAREVDEFLATLARLGAAEAAAPPPELRARVLAQLPTVRQLPPRTTEPDGRASAVPRRLPRLALAASVALAALFGGIAVQQHQQAERARTETARLAERQASFSALLTAPDAKVTSASSGGATGTVVWSRSRGQAGFIASGMPVLPPDRTYELWYDDAGTMRPAGLLPGSGSGALLLSGAIQGASGVGVTVEPAGGSAHPSGAPVMVLAFV